MFIKNQTFSDHDTLIEMLFDFEIGTASPFINEIREKIAADIAQNKAFLEYLQTLEDAEEKLEVEDEEMRLRLAEILMQQFPLFSVEAAKLYGEKDGNRELFYEIDLV